jgi:hypothetical protein
MLPRGILGSGVSTDVTVLTELFEKNGKKTEGKGKEGEEKGCRFG